MTKKENKSFCSTSLSQNCCQVEAVVSVDERGQLVLPKELRNKAGISAGDKLAIASWNCDDQHCLVLLKADDLAVMVKNILGPMMTELKK